MEVIIKMRVTYIYFFIILVFTSLNIRGQNVFFKSKPVNTSKYSDYKGSPYLYKDWMVADIESRDGTFYKHVLLNYNGYEETFEVTGKNGTVTLSEDLYDKITVYPQDPKKGKIEWFERGVHYDIATSLANLIYASDSIKLVRFFHVRVVETSNEIYGDISVRRKFIPSRQYAVLFRSKLTYGKLSWYKLGLAFKNEALVNEILDKNKLKLSKEEDLIKFMYLMDEQLRYP